MKASEQAILRECAGGGGSDDSGLNALLEQLQTQIADNPAASAHKRCFSGDLLKLLLLDLKVATLLRLYGYQPRELIKRFDCALADYRSLVGVPEPDIDLSQILQSLLIKNAQYQGINNGFHQVNIRSQLTPLCLFQKLVCISQTFAAKWLIQHGVRFEDVDKQIDRIQQKQRQKVRNKFKRLARLYHQKWTVYSGPNPGHTIYQLEFKQKHVSQKEAMQAAVLTDQGLIFLFEQTPFCFEFTSRKIAVLAVCLNSESYLSLSLEHKAFLGHRLGSGCSGSGAHCIFSDSPKTDSDIEQMFASSHPRSNAQNYRHKTANDNKPVSRFEKNQVEPVTGFSHLSREEMRQKILAEYATEGHQGSGDNTGNIGLSFGARDTFLKHENKTECQEELESAHKELLLTVEADRSESIQCKLAVVSDKGLSLHLEVTPFRLVVTGEIKLLFETERNKQVRVELKSRQDDRVLRSVSGQIGAVFYGERFDTGRWSGIILLSE